MPPFNKFTSKAKEVIRKSHELAMERGQNHVDLMHLLTALILQEESIVFSILEKMEVDTTLLADNLADELEESGGKRPDVMSASYQMYLHPDFANTLENGVKIASKMNDEFVSTEHLFLAIFDMQNKASDLLRSFKIDKKKVEEVLAELRKGGEATTGEKQQFRAVTKYTRNLTEMAQNDQLDPVIGRDAEISRIIQILSRRTKNNPILIGEAGVGKTAVVEGLAQRINKGDVPESLKDKQLVSLDLGALLAGTKYRGEFEDRLKKIMKEIARADGEIILFIDEIHTIIGAGNSDGSMDASNMLKPALARGELHAIGATTLKEYQKHIEKDMAFTRRFQTVHVNEPNTEDAISILRGLKEKYELFHGVRITDDAIVSAVQLSSRYISDRFLPDKAIDLIDEASSALRMSLENMPPELEVAHRKIMRLEIEKEALKNDIKKGSKKESDNAKKRTIKIENEIANLKEGSREFELKWTNEKDALVKIRESKKQLESLRLDVEKAQAQADLTRAAEIRYSEIPEIEKELKIQEQKLRKLQSSRKVLKEDIKDGDIAEIVAKWTGIPVNRMLEEEVQKLTRMEDEIKKQVVGQDDAVQKISNAVKRSRAGISDPSHPIGSFMLLGPTGVGKTELSKALAEFMFNDEKSLVRVDMSEFMERHSVSKLIGSPPGYVGHDEGGGLTETIRHKPYSVVLFDEIEKAHPEVFNILLQVLDNGQLTDAKGRKINFRNTIIILTSNIGSEFISKMETIGFNNGDENQDYESAKLKVMDSLKEHFRPEFLNRLDEIILFDILSKKAIEEIVKLQINIVKERLAEKEIKMKISKEVFGFLAEKGYDPQNGARPLKRLIQNKILTKLAQIMIENNMLQGGEVAIRLKNDEIVVDIIKGRKRARKIKSGQGQVRKIGQVV